MIGREDEPRTVKVFFLFTIFAGTAARVGVGVAISRCV